MNPDTLLRMERLYLITALRVQRNPYPTRTDLRELDALDAYLRAEKRHWIERGAA